MESIIVRRPVKDGQSALPDELHPVLKRIYQARGIEDADQLERGLKQLLPLDSMKNINVAAHRIYKSLQNQERIVIVGDFDADGATSTAVLLSSLKAMGAQHVDFLVPNRFEFGYGLTPEIVRVAHGLHPHLLITVDNGIANHDGVDAANGLGIDVIVTDHHLPSETLPAAYTIVNPNQPGCEFPSKNLAGVGVIFYVMLALRQCLRQEGWFEAQRITEPNMAELLDLVALGTVADVVPLDKNNRILVHQGVQRIRAGKARPGIMALIKVAKRQWANLVSSDLGFALGPRLNAAGRLDDMSIGIQCLLSTEQRTAFTLAEELQALNQERRDIESGMKAQALYFCEQLAQKQCLSLGLCLYQADWHQGVVGILASRIKESFHRPVIAFAKTDDKTLKGSARSIKSVHIRDVLAAINAKQPGLILKFGGHAMAAGLSLLEENLRAFSEAFNKELAGHIEEDALKGEIVTDGELAAEDLTLPFAKLLQQAGPWGQAFPEPSFDGEFTIISQRLVANKHVKFVLETSRGGYLLDAMLFNADLNQWPNQRAKRINAAYRLTVNDYQGLPSVQLMLEHLQDISAH